jgi:prepilin-type N-terminal cleavage/methylation domain-containing protein
MKQGFTLLEIILSLAILAGALAALGEVMRLADRNATLADDETQAQILAASVMDEIAAGSRELTAVDQVAVNSTDDPAWVFSIAMDQTAYDELVAVRVRVEQKIDAQFQPANFELTRWMPNPNFIAANTTDDSSTSSSSTSTSSSSSSSSSNSGSGGGQK